MPKATHLSTRETDKKRAPSGAADVAKSPKRGPAVASASRASFADRARAVVDKGRGAGAGDALGDRALRTREHLIETAKKLFLERGYGGATIDQIAAAAGVSRASFYTYFPSKRETLLAAGTKGLEESMAALRDVSKIPDKWTLNDLKVWIARYLRYLDEHGTFLLVWSQAAWNDAELRSIGSRGSMRAAGIIGTELQRLGASDRNDPRILGQALMAMLDRFWYVWKVTGAPFGEDEVLTGLAHIMGAMLR
jgi:AcrR family transcriptional regulator